MLWELLRASTEKIIRNGRKYPFTSNPKGRNEINRFCLLKLLSLRVHSIANVFNYIYVFDLCNVNSSVKLVQYVC